MKRPDLAMDTLAVPTPAPMDPATPSSTTVPAAASPAVKDEIAAEASRLDLPVPAVSRGVAIGIGVLATLALVFALDWAQGFVISLLVGIFLAYTLNPLVVWLERMRIPRIVGTSIVMLAVVCALALGTYSLRGQLQSIVEQLPEAASKVSAKLASVRIDSLIDIKKVQTAARTIEKATGEAEIVPSVARQPATHVVVDQPAFKLSSALWT